MGTKINLTGALAIVATAASNFLGSADAQENGNTNFNSNRGIVACEVNGDGAEQITREDGSVTIDYGLLHDDNAIYSDNGGNVAPNKICDLTKPEKTFEQEVIPADNHICVKLSNGKIDVYLPDGEEFDKTAEILSTEFFDANNDETIGDCLISLEEGIRKAPIFTAPAVDLK